MSKNTLGELKKNTLIIAIASLGSKAISLILAPLYSFYLTTEQYGTMDLILASAGVLLPLVCFDIFEGTFRYASDKEREPKVVLSSTFSICLFSTLLIMLLALVFSKLFSASGVVCLCVLSAVLDSYVQVLSQFARGRGDTVTFGISGILNSVLLLLMNVVLMVLLDRGLNGWVISFLTAKIAVLLYLVIKLRVWKIYSVQYIDKTFVKEALCFCIPLIPSAAMWWVMNISDRYVISIVLGVGATGIYAVANKLPAMLSILENVFYQAWQTTAIQTKYDDNRDGFYSAIFMKYLRFLSIGAFGILFILKPMILAFFSQEYSSAWECSAVLVLGIMVHALAGNLGTIYTVFKDTKGALKTSAIGAAVNVITNIIFVPMYGMNAAAWTTLISYIVVLIVRWIDCKKFVRLKVPVREIAVYAVLVCLQLCLYYVPGVISYLIRIVVFAGSVFLNRKMLIGILKRT